MRYIIYFVSAGDAKNSHRGKENMLVLTGTHTYTYTHVCLYIRLWDKLYSRLIRVEGFTSLQASVSIYQYY